MKINILELCDLYGKLKHQALCLDVEATRANGPISVIGLYKPKDGPIECESYIKGKNLTKENLKQAFKGCKMIITFNGNSFDIPKIKKEFPGVIPQDIIHMDLYFMAKELNLDTNLKVLETTFKIDRLDEFTKKRRIAVKLWRKYSKGKNQQALKTLIEYNKQDTINLYPIAEKLIEIARKK